ncbi:MAG TPA: asparagine synthase (glutamine-hydrolyzing) [Candidatus Polarisedimenticolia bacterium]|nr:asparagine synthase (glutamine-hydrolyzing) [Candidatus Polarisedimenticolia bacterium]
MCGIAGFYGSRIAEEERGTVLAEMVQTLRHRGPDSDGYYLHGQNGVGMRRLRIIDLETGDPPLFNEKRDVCVVFNGEIYNYRSLRLDLEKKGHRFASRTDTEVIAHLYEEKGERLVEHLRGMFAIALLDTARGRLLLARDRIGIKPLYYAETDGGTVLFGSELKAILAYPGLRREIDPIALNAFLAYGYVPDPLTMFQRVQKLLPGHFLVAEGGQVRTERYWDVPSEADEGATPEELAGRLHEALDDSVACHLKSDVPLGAFLSGGVDSSAVVATMARVSGRPPQTFSIGFREAEFDELRYARAVAGRYQTEHHEAIQETSGLESVEEFLRYFDEPFGDSSMVPTWLLSAFARRRITVAVSGDGGDEIFSGYTHYQAILEYGFLEFLPLSWRRRCFSFLQRMYPPSWRGWKKLGYLGLSPLERCYSHLHQFSDSLKRDSLYTPEFLGALGKFDSRDLFAPYHRPHWDPLRQATYLDLKTYLPGDILTKVDRMSMAHALEVRVPLLDHRLVEMAFRIPSRYQIRKGRTKWLFHQVVDSRLPPPIWRRPKKGFSIPLSTWLSGVAGERVGEILLSDRARARGYLNSATVRRLWNDHREGKREHAPRLWTLYCLELWFRMYAGEPAGAIRERPFAAGPSSRLSRNGQGR